MSLQFMKSKERYVARGLERLYPSIAPIKEPEDEFSPFDFECDLYLIEVKNRSKVWDPWFIEKVKYDMNMEIANNLSKDFIFLTEVKGRIFLYNISKLTREGHNFNWRTKLLPKSTEISKEGNHDRVVSFLYIKDAKQIQL